MSRRPFAVRDSWQQRSNQEGDVTVVTVPPGHGSQPPSHSPTPPGRTGRESAPPAAPPIVTVPRPPQIITVETGAEQAHVKLPPTLPTDPGTLNQLSTRLLAEIRDVLTAQVQKGIVEPYTLAVTTTASTFTTFSPAFFSLSLINDGPSDIQYAVPYGARGVWVTLKSTEQISFNAITAVFYSLGLRLVNAGGSATVRAVGLL